MLLCSLSGRTTGLSALNVLIGFLSDASPTSAVYYASLHDL
jgi:hypothetical protein